jgi:hypothetical protein
MMLMASPYLVWLGDAGQTAPGEAADQLLWVEPEPLQQAGVLVGVDLVGQFLVGLAGLLVVACWRSMSMICALSSCMAVAPVCCVSADGWICVPTASPVQSSGCGGS